MNRKYFLLQTASLAALAINPFKTFPQSKQNPEPYKPEIVKEFVGAGHKDLDKVKSMLNDYPNLIYSRYDWGNGDFEEAIEGAGHVGDKAIANYLIEKGARANIFVLSMLGETEIVKAVLKRYPNLINSLGPHGFTLLHHAKRGGEEAKELLSFFESSGLNKDQVKIK